MSKTTNPLAYLLVGALLLVFLGLGAYFLPETHADNTNLPAGQIFLAETEHNFGTIGLDPAHYTFPIENVGEGPLTIAYISTSCGCTTAQIKKDGELNRTRFGMDHGNLPKANTILKPGERAEILVTYNPLAHGLKNAAGVFERRVYIQTENPSEEHTLTVNMHVDPEINS